MRTSASRSAPLRSSSIARTWEAHDLVLRNLARGVASDREEECFAAIRACKRGAVAFGIDLDEFATRLGEVVAKWMEQ